MPEIRQIFVARTGAYGSPRVPAELVAEGVAARRKKDFPPDVPCMVERLSQRPLPGHDVAQRNTSGREEVIFEAAVMCQHTSEWSCFLLGNRGRQFSIGQRGRYWRQNLGMSSVTIKSLRYSWPGASDPVLDIGMFNLERGESLFLSGPSGSGKSTLLAAIAGVVDIPHDTIRVAGMDVGALSGSQRDRFRADHLGIIFQVFNLLPWLSPSENVLLPCRFSDVRRKKAGDDSAATAEALLAELGLNTAALLHGPSSALSVGQQQRVAAARALIGSPDVVLADEPTSALDEDAKDGFIRLLLRECANAGASLLFVSHDRTLARHFDRAADLSELNGVDARC